MEQKQKLLEVKNLSTYFFLRDSVVKSVDGISFTIYEGEIVGLAGESGCGKSVTTQSILHMVPAPGKIVEGQILLKGEDICKYSREQLRMMRGKRISIVFQDALAALNPVISIGEQLADVVKDHNDISWKDSLQKACNMLRNVGIPYPESRMKQYAHEFSGGMQQRSVIGAAMICQPDLIIADEPTTALDVTIQMQILTLLKKARDESGTSVLYISHDLANVSSICDRVMIMYAGEIIEQAKRKDLYSDPLHPYTQGLLDSIPKLGGDTPVFLHTIEGSPPKPANYPKGCRFAPRCKYVMDICKNEHPNEYMVEDRIVRCFKFNKNPEVKHG